MLALNPGWLETGARSLPDGDAELPQDVARRFVVPICLSCGGAMKPDVVFFGENVPKDRVDAAFRVLANSEALLVVGSSLAVFSGYRFVRQASLDRIPIAIATIGPARGEELATVRIEGRLGDVLPELAARLLGRKAAWN